MKGVIIATHGSLCNGFIEAGKLFFEESMEQLDICPLKMDSSIDDYTAEIIEKCKAVNSGDGVIILLDLIGGTPSNTVLKLMIEEKLDDVKVITGVNFPIFLELMGQRMTNNYDLEHLIEVGKEGIRELVIPISDEDEEEIM